MLIAGNDLFDWRQFEYVGESAYAFLQSDRAFLGDNVQLHMITRVRNIRRAARRAKAWAILKHCVDTFLLWINCNVKQLSFQLWDVFRRTLFRVWVV